MNGTTSIISTGLLQGGELIANHSKTFGFNSNILEANVVNIIILASGVIYLGYNFLSSALSLREQKITESIEEADEKLQQAKIRLAESEKQLNQSKVIIEQIKKEAETAAQKIKKSILVQGKLDIERLTNNGKNSIEKAELQIRKQLQQQITDLALRKATSQLRELLTPALQSKLIDTNITQLGGNL